MTEFYLGYRWNPQSGKVAKRVAMDLSKQPHVTVTAPTGSSKGVSIEIVNLLTGLSDCSVFNLDMASQNGPICAEARRQMGHRVWPINPKHQHVAQYSDLASCGYNPMDALNVNDPARFLMRATAIAEAIAPSQHNAGSGKFFDTGALMLATGLIMYVKLRDGDQANLGTVRDLLTEEELTAEDGLLLKGLRYTAVCAVATGHRATANLMARFTNESRSNRDIISTLDNNTRFLDDDDIRADLSKSGIDFGTLKDQKTTVMAMLPAGTEQQFLAPWLRILVNGALDSIYARGGTGLRVVFMLSEAAGIGRLDPLVAAIGQGRKFGICLAPIVWQDLNQAREVFGVNNAKTLLANSGCLFAFNPGNDSDTAEFLSRLSGNHLVAGLSVSDDPSQLGDRGTIAPQNERVWSPERIRNLPVRHALLFRAGEAEPISLYCPPFWDIEACRRVARPDPYHGDMPARQTGRSWRRLVLAGAGVALLAGLLVLLA